MEKMGGAGGGRVRSASAGRDKRTEMACRYWAILVENLRRAVDDLYKTCEGDESCTYAREVAMILENYTKDFKSLVKWLMIKVEYESTPPPQRPKSLTWDIRKTSPMGKGTPVSTPGKLTPTRQLLLCSPAKRQLNFDTDDVITGGSRVRSRQVSETIKEVGHEVDCSPHQSWQNLDNIDNNTNNEVIKNSDEVEENTSEHEKSDSEQEKDSSGSKPVIKENTEDTTLAEERLDPMTESTDSVVSEADKTESTSKNSSTGDLTKCKKSGSKTRLSCKSVGGSKSVSSNKSVSKTATTAARVNEKQTKTAADKTSSGGLTKTAASKKSDDQPKPAPRPTSSFASTVKSSFSKVASGPTTAATVAKTTPATTSNPRITRAKTTISSSSKSSSSSGSGAVSRKTAAGLLITTTTAKTKPASAPTKSSSRPSSAAAPGSSSPKQQRISLVARQSIFANENKNPNRKVSKTEAARPKAPLTHSKSSDGNNTVGLVNPAGSNTSLSSGSSSRSWADTVRAGLYHTSVEDLSLNLPRYDMLARVSCSLLMLQRWLQERESGGQ